MELLQMLWTYFFSEATGGVLNRIFVLANMAFQTTEIIG